MNADDWHKIADERSKALNEAMDRIKSLEKELADGQRILGNVLGHRETMVAALNRLLPEDTPPEILEARGWYLDHRPALSVQPNDSGKCCHEWVEDQFCRLCRKCGRLEKQA